ncbi:MAG TPA: anti-sigma factor [Chloroflexota bacterium]|jgi:anti-sigma-K factor RskA|nr:anti-sigma factor [Chloroflexota bacterium]
MTHDELRESLGAYALDALSSSERDEVDAHLQTCAHCRAEVTELSSAADQLALLTIERDPPPGMRDRLMAMVEQDRREWERARATESATATATPQAAPGEGTRPGPLAGQTAGSSWWRQLIERLQRTPRLAYSAGGLMVLALIVIGVVLFNRNNVNTLHTYACSAPQPAVNGEDFRTTTCTLQVRSDHTIEVAFNGLPPLTPTRAYELWLIPPKGKPVPVTGFAPGGTQDFGGTYKIDAASYAEAAVTIERAPGNSPVPHLPIVLVIPLNNAAKA